MLLQFPDPQGSIRPWRPDTDRRERLPVVLLRSRLGLRYTRAAPPPAAGRTGRSPGKSGTAPRGSLDIGPGWGTSRRGLSHPNHRPRRWTNPVVRTSVLHKIPLLRPRQHGPPTTHHPGSGCLKKSALGCVASGANCRLVARDLRTVLRTAWTLGRSSRRTPRRGPACPGRRNRDNPIQTPPGKHIEGRTFWRHKEKGCPPSQHCLAQDSGGQPLWSNRPRNPLYGRVMGKTNDGELELALTLPIVYRHRRP
jgi:hypothetical protein